MVDTEEPKRVRRVKKQGSVSSASLSKTAGGEHSRHDKKYNPSDADSVSRASGRFGVLIWGLDAFK
jgi:hypothetical protein